MSDNPNQQTATFGGGCFWCTEAVFRELQGVESVVPGYAGGHVDDPTYQQVCAGNTGHAEVIQIRFNPAETPFADLLSVFLATHDPTTLNRQGNDVGTQYRSAIFYHDEEQKEQAEAAIAALDESGELAGPVVTEVTPLTNFFAAEDYHHDYFSANLSQPYCAAVIRPKLEKFRRTFAERLRT